MTVMFEILLGVSLVSPEISDGILKIEFITVPICPHAVIIRLTELLNMSLLVFFISLLQYVIQTYSHY